MLSKEELEAIKVGDFVKYEDKFLNESDIIIARVKETRVRCGEQGNVFEDYLITANDKELDYKDVLQHITPDKLEFFLEQNGKYTPHIFEVIKRDQEYKVTDQALLDALSEAGLKSKFAICFPCDDTPEFQQNLEKLENAIKNSTLPERKINNPNTLYVISQEKMDFPHGEAVEEEKGEEK